MAAQGGRIQCLDRSLDILELLASRGEMTAAQVGRELGLNASTVHNIAATLAARTYLVGQGGRYRIGPGAAILAARWDPVAALPDLAAPHLHEVVRRTGESAVVAVMRGGTAILLTDAVGPAEVAAHFPRRDYPFPLTIATGRTIIAYGDPAAWEPIIAAHLEHMGGAEGEEQWTAAHWREELERIRSGEPAKLRRSRGVYAVAAPVWGPARAAVIAALGVSCPSYRAEEPHLESMRAAVIEAAQALSRDLGGAGASQATHTEEQA